ncbi:MAG: hypothetical protein ABJZ69_10210, partial [Hyphomicrobiales bacterium]
MEVLNFGAKARIAVHSLSSISEGAHGAIAIDQGREVSDTVRRQSFWNQERRRLSEFSAHLVCVIMLR